MSELIQNGICDILGSGFRQMMFLLLPRKATAWFMRRQIISTSTAEAVAG